MYQSYPVICDDQWSPKGRHWIWPIKFPTCTNLTANYDVAKRPDSMGRGKGFWQKSQSQAQRLGWTIQLTRRRRPSGETARLPGPSRCTTDSSTPGLRAVKEKPRTRGETGSRAPQKGCCRSLPGKAALGMAKVNFHWPPRAGKETTRNKQRRAAEWVSWECRASLAVAQGRSSSAGAVRVSTEYPPFAVCCLPLLHWGAGVRQPETTRDAPDTGKNR